jgi:hypothetical protein
VLDGKELEVVVTVGLNALLRAGALPLLVESDDLHIPEEPKTQ